MSSDMKDTELETRIENMLDFFTQPGEKYLKDLQNDLVDLIKRETDKARIDELDRLQKLHTRTYTQTVTDNTGAVYVNETHGYISKYETQERIAQLKQQQGEGK